MVGIEEFVIDIQQKDGYCTGKRLNGVVQVVNPDDYEALCLSPTLPAVPLYLPKTTIRDVRQLCAALQAYVQRYCNK